VRLSWRSCVAGLAIFVVGLFLVYGTIVGARVAGLGVAVTRGSVDASIPSGSVIFGRWVRPGGVRRGQQVIFEERDGARALPPQLRRVVDVESVNGHVIARTRDADERENRYVLSNPVVEPVFTLPYIGYVLAMLLTPIGWFLGFALPAGVLAFICLWHVWRPDEELESVGFPAPVYAPPQA
jgi:hypothetical protein